MILNLITAPATEPFVLAEMEDHVRLPGQLTEERALGESLITTVRQLAETVTKRALITQTWELTLDEFPAGRDAISLPLPPLQKVNSITYIDAAGVTQTYAANLYRTVQDSHTAYLFPIYGERWPSTLNDVAVIKINFTCGYGPISPLTEYNIPGPILQWMKLNFANYFENRETVVIEASRAVLLDTTATLADGLISNYRLLKL